MLTVNTHFLRFLGVGGCGVGVAWSLVDLTGVFPPEGGASALASGWRPVREAELIAALLRSPRR